MAMAVTVPVVDGTVMMDGHRPESDIYTGLGPVPIAQLRVTNREGDIVELALTRGQINDLYDMFELYR